MQELLFGELNMTKFFNATALHAHAETGGGIWHGILTEVILDAVIDTLKVIPFLFLTYLLMEFIEHKASDKVTRALSSSGRLAPLVGGIFGAIPQCAFSAVGANLYVGRVISAGTVIAVFLSTSDEMLPIMLSSGLHWQKILIIMGYKILCAVICGFVIDLILSLARRNQREINIDEICENDNCHCERGIIFSAIHHTLTISLFILIVTLFTNGLVFFIGAESLGNIMDGIPVISHIISAVVGLIPSCGVSVALTSLAMEGIISVGTMMSGLLSGAGVGILILLRLNKHRKENTLIILTLVVCGALFGLLSEIVIPPII